LFDFARRRETRRATLFLLALAHPLLSGHCKHRLPSQDAPGSTRDAVGLQAQAALVGGPEMGTRETHPLK
jgi:hypothetical protein